LQGRDLAGCASDNLADPYLVVKLGKQEFSTRERYKKNTRNPKFYEYFEFQLKLPGVNDVLITVKDKNDVYMDHVIGCTVIDVEDRYRLES
jgi:Ca2+-dependent lipid-binding protein